MNKIIAVFDSDFNYSCRLAEALRQREEFTFQLITFTNEEKLLHYAQGHYIHLLLVQPGLYSENVKKIKAKKVMLLTNEMKDKDGSQDSDMTDVPYLYKYQSVSGIVSEMLHYYKGISTNAVGGKRDDSISVLGIFSPVSFNLHEKMLRSLLKEYENSPRALLISLSAFSQFSHNDGKDYMDISDAYYFWKQNEASAMDYVRKIIRRDTHFDYIPSAVFPEDMMQIAVSDLVTFLDDLICACGYKINLIDFGYFGQDVSLIMNLCNQQLIPYYYKDENSENKLKQYGQYLEKSGLGFWKSQTRCIPISFQGDEAIGKSRELQHLQGISL